jgi:hypothetical protein
VLREERGNEHVPLAFWTSVMAKLLISIAVLTIALMIAFAIYVITL